MKNLIQNKTPSFLVNGAPHSWQCYSIAEKYFYLVLCHLQKKYADDRGCFLGHDSTIKNGIPSFKSFGLSQRICKSARKKLRDGGLIIFRHVYGEKGYRIGTEYALCEAAFRESPKAIHALILNKKPLELCTPAGILHEITLISP